MRSKIVKLLNLNILNGNIDIYLLEIIEKNSHFSNSCKIFIDIHMELTYVLFKKVHKIYQYSLG